MVLKTCRKCGEVKGREPHFYRHKRMADGFLNECKRCRDAYVASWTEKNRERKREISRAWATANRHRYIESGRKWHAEHSTDRYYRRRNDPIKWAATLARDAKRRAQKKRAAPSWAVQFFIEEAYDLMRRRNEVTGIEWHVDHIVPLQSDIVCGLHSHDNLQVIPAVMNLSKNNRWWPDMPTRGAD